MVRVLGHSLVALPGRDPRHRLAILHGAFGAGRNWGTIARRLVQSRPEWGVVLTDLRLHGDSQGFPPPHTLAAAAGDILALGQALGVPIAAILGHSLGGKVALLYTAHHPADLRQAWVVDCTPAATPPSGSAWQMWQAVRTLPGEFASRQHAVEALMRAGFARPVAEWMTANLEWAEGHYRWRLDLDGLETLLRDFFQTDAWPIVTDPPSGIDLHFIKATDSDSIGENALRQLDSLSTRRNVSVHMVPGGHWIHTDNPAHVLQLLIEHLP